MKCIFFGVNISHELSIQSALDAIKELNFEPIELTLVSDGRQRVYKAVVSTGKTDKQIKSMRVAVRLANPRRPPESVAYEQKLAWDWSQMGARIATPIHPAPIKTNAGLVGIWEWLEFPSRPMIAARDWGALARNLHDTGKNIPAPQANLFGLINFKRDEINKAASTPGHPLYSYPGLVEDYWKEVDKSMKVMAEIQKTAVQSCIHNDFSPGNVINTQDGPVTFDFEWSGRGPIAADFALLAVGVKRYGWPQQYMDEFKQGYGIDNAPPDSEIDAFRRVSELSSVGFAMMAADIDDEHYREFIKRMPIIRNPDATTETWVHVGGVNTMETGYRIVLDNAITKTQSLTPTSAPGLTLSLNAESSSTATAA